MNTLGRVFRVSLFGESHGPCVGCLIDGCPPGLPLGVEDLRPDLARRRSGAPGTTPRQEKDDPEILSGVYQGRATGSPILIVLKNSDTRSADYEAFLQVPRPGHADFTSRVRYRGFADPRGSGHFSGRVTGGLVAAGAVAKKLLPGLTFTTTLLEAGGRTDLEAAIAEAVAAEDSIGGLVELRVAGLKAGLGEPFFGSLEGLAAEALYAVPGVRGVEFGDGFRAAALRGSEHNDPFVSADGATAKNGAGGANGGLSNGNDLVVRVAVKPASTIGRSQSTFDFAKGAMTDLAGKGRHDACIALRAQVALEAALALVLADLSLLSEGYDHATGAAE